MDEDTEGGAWNHKERVDSWWQTEGHCRTAEGLIGGGARKGAREGGSARGREGARGEEEREGGGEGGSEGGGSEGAREGAKEGGQTENEGCKHITITNAATLSPDRIATEKRTSLLSVSIMPLESTWAKAENIVATGM